MPKLLSVAQQDRSYYIGAQSDGSDRELVEASAWVATVLDDVGRTHVLEFDHSPTSAEIVAALPVTVDLDPADQSEAQELLASAVAKVDVNVGPMPPIKVTPVEG